jgi:hypothetical protein
MPTSPPVAPPPPGTAAPEDPRHVGASAQQLWEQPQPWDPQPRVAPFPGAHPGDPYAAAPYGVGPYGQPYGQPQWGPPPLARGSVPQPQPLKTAVGMMWIGAAVTALGSLSVVLFAGQIREQIEDQAIAEGRIVSESTLDAAVSVGVVFGVATGLITAGLWAWMAVMNGKGRSWARIVATVFATLGILFGLIGLLGAGLGGTTAVTAPDVVRQIITLGLAVGTTALLWSKQNADYFRANS